MPVLKKFFILYILLLVSLFGISKGKKDFYTDLITVYYAIEPKEIITPEVLSNIRLIKIPAGKINFPANAVDNEKIVSSDSDSVRVNDYSSGELLYSFDIKGKKRVLASDDKIIVAIENNSIKIIDVLIGRVVFELENSIYKELPYLAVYDGKVFASAYSDKNIKVWDIYNGKNIDALVCEEGVKGMIAQNGKLVAISDNGFFDFTIWDIQTDAVVKNSDDVNSTGKAFSDTFSYNTEALPLYGDGVDMFFTNSDISTKKWNMQTGEIISELPHAKNGLAANDTDTVIITGEKDVLVNGEKYVFKNRESISDIFVSDDRFYVVFENETYVLDPDVMAANKRKNDLMKQHIREKEQVVAKEMGARIRFALGEDIVHPHEIAIDDYFKYGVRDIIKEVMTNTATKKDIKNIMTENIIVYIKNNFISEKTLFLLSFMEFDEEKKNDLSISLSDMLKNRFLTKEEYEIVKNVTAYIPTLFYFHNR